MEKCVDCANNGVSCNGNARGFACMRFTPKCRSVSAGADAEPRCDNGELVRALKVCVLAIEDMRHTDDEICRMELSRTALDLGRTALGKAGER